VLFRCNIEECADLWRIEQHKGLGLHYSNQLHCAWSAVLASYGRPIFLPCGFYLSSLFSSPNLSGRRLDVYHTSTHGVALARI